MDPNSITRREILKAGVGLVAATSGLEQLVGCATLGFKEEGPVLYAPLKESKIQPPREGCLTGLFETMQDYSHYQQDLDVLPALGVIFSPRMLQMGDFESAHAGRLSKQGITPVVYAGGPLEDIASGKADATIEKIAEEATEYGSINGGFFLVPFNEMNISKQYAPEPWCDDPRNFQKAWRRMWQIFEKKGANKFTTWLIEYHIDFPFGGYWPGDEFVDWVGISAHNREKFRQYYGYRDFKELVVSAYGFHKEKPFMVSELSTTTGKDQPGLIKKAFEKDIPSMPRIKGVIYWDNMNWELGDNHTLSPESLTVLKEALKNPYYITAAKKQ